MILLQLVTDRLYNERGFCYSYRCGSIVKIFKNVAEAKAYVDENLSDIPENAEFFTGSASSMTYLTQYLSTVRSRANGLA